MKYKLFFLFCISLATQNIFTEYNRLSDVVGTQLLILPPQSLRCYFIIHSWKTRNFAKIIQSLDKNLQTQATTAIKDFDTPLAYTIRDNSLYER